MMDSEREQTTTPSALDRVAAALTALSQDTAAAIAQRAGVGYSTATKRLRLLEDAGQAETFRADDGRTLWRQPTNPPRGHDDGDPPTSTTYTEPDEPSEPTAPLEQNVSSTVGARPKDEPPGGPPAEVPAPTPPAEVDQPPHDTPARSNAGGSEQAPTARDGDSTPADGDGQTAETADGAEPREVPDPEVNDSPGMASGPDEDAGASAGGKPRRSKGSLRGAIRDVLEAHPDQAMRTSQLCRAIDEANAGSGAARASAGAVVNAVHKLVADGLAVQVVERPAAFQLAPRTDR